MIRCIQALELLLGQGTPARKWCRISYFKIIFWSTIRREKVDHTLKHAGITKRYVILEYMGAIMKICHDELAILKINIFRVTQ